MCYETFRTRRNPANDGATDETAARTRTSTATTAGDRAGGDAQPERGAFDAVKGVIEGGRRQGGTGTA